jgi:hypothetical protein
LFTSGPDVLEAEDDEALQTIAETLDATFIDRVGGVDYVYVLVTVLERLCLNEEVTVTDKVTPLSNPSSPGPF